MDYAVFPHKIVQTGDVVVFLYEALTMFRQISYRWAEAAGRSRAGLLGLLGWHGGKAIRSSSRLQASGITAGWTCSATRTASAMRVTERFRRAQLRNHGSAR